MNKKKTTDNTRKEENIKHEVIRRMTSIVLQNYEYRKYLYFDEYVYYLKKSEI